MSASIGSGNTMFNGHRVGLPASILMVLFAVALASCHSSSPATTAPSQFSPVKLLETRRIGSLALQETVRTPCGRAQTCSQLKIRRTLPGTMLTLSSPLAGPNLEMWDDRMFPEGSAPVGQEVCLEYVRDESGKVSARQVFLPNESWPQACGANTGRP